MEMEMKGANRIKNATSSGTVTWVDAGATYWTGKPREADLGLKCSVEHVFQELILSYYQHLTWADSGNSNQSPSFSLSGVPELTFLARCHLFHFKAHLLIVWCDLTLNVKTYLGSKTLPHN